MTILEVVAQLREGGKTLYNGKMSQPHFCLTMMRIESGTCKMSTIKEVFNLFGYTGDWNEWYKASNIPTQPKHLQGVYQ